jgi:hypothetical protein
MVVSASTKSKRKRHSWLSPIAQSNREMAGVIASIVLLLFPTLRWHHPPCCVGVFALVVLGLPHLAHPHHRQHHKLASA